MKQRLTYLVKDVSNFNLDQLEVTKDSFSVRNLQAAKEQHLTIGLDELPQEVTIDVDVGNVAYLTWSTDMASSQAMSRTSHPLGFPSSI